MYCFCVCSYVLLHFWRSVCYYVLRSHVSFNLVRTVIAHKIRRTSVYSAVVYKIGVLIESVLYVRLFCYKSMYCWCRGGRSFANIYIYIYIPFTNCYVRVYLRIYSDTACKCLRMQIICVVRLQVSGHILSEFVHQYVDDIPYAITIKPPYSSYIAQNKLKGFYVCQTSAHNEFFICRYLALYTQSSILSLYTSLLDALKHIPASKTFRSPWYNYFEFDVS